MSKRVYGRSGRCALNTLVRSLQQLTKDKIEVTTFPKIFYQVEVSKISLCRIVFRVEMFCSVRSTLWYWKIFLKSSEGIEPWQALCLGWELTHSIQSAWSCYFCLDRPTDRSWNCVCLNQNFVLQNHDSAFFDSSNKTWAMRRGMYQPLNVGTNVILLLGWLNTAQPGG